MRWIILLSLVMILATSCAVLDNFNRPKSELRFNEIVVKRKYKDAPVFVVYPSSDYVKEIEYANEFENALLFHQQKVFERPIKVLTKITVDDFRFAVGSDASIIKTSSQNVVNIRTSEKTQLRIRKETFYSFSTANTDFFVVTYHLNRSAKVYEAKRNELVGWLHYPSANNTASMRKLGRFMHALGILVPTKIKKQGFVARTDVPIEPAFAIIPVNFTNRQLKFAEYVENRFFEIGVSIIRRPAWRKIEKTDFAGTRKGEARQQSAAMMGEKGHKGRISTFYYELESNNANFYVKTYAKSRQVRIVHKEENTVVSIFKLGRRIATDRRIIGKKLGKLGIFGSKFQHRTKP